MTYPQHTLHVYQKPKTGNLFLSSHPTYHYRHQIINNGWYDTASCDLALSRVQAETALEQWIGNRVAVYVDNPAQPIWEGLITRVSYSVGGATFSRSLDSMFNQVRGIFKIKTAAGITVTTNHNELDSQSIYGVKHGTFDGYYEDAAVLTTFLRVNAIRESIVGLVGWPQTSVTAGGGRPVLVSLEMKGFYHTLMWEEFYDVATANGTITQFITTILAALQNGATFFNNADLTAIQANTTFAATSRRDWSAQPAWNNLQRVLGAGSTTQFWIMGITPSDFVTGTRRFYYRPTNTTTEYVAYSWDNLRVRNQWGGLVKPWNVIPDRTIRINDALVGWSALGDDPRETYIERIQYEADQQRVIWAGGDDLSMEGTMQLQKFYKMFGKLGAYPSTSWQ